MYMGQDEEKIFNLTSLNQFKSWDNHLTMDELDGQGQVTHGAIKALRFTICMSMA